MKRKMKIFILLLALIFGAIFFFRVFKARQAVQSALKTAAPVDAIAVKVALVKKEDVNRVFSYVGSLKAKDEANVFSKVTGKLIEYTVSEGDAVQKGQVIAFIDRDETGLKYEPAKVESPISGIVGRLLLDKGASVLPIINIAQGVSLAVIVNMDQMLAQLNAPEPDMPQLKNGLKARIQVDAYPNEDFEGIVTKVAAVADAVSRTLPFEITISNKDHRLKSGMFAKVELIIQARKGVPVVAKESVLGKAPNFYVYVAENGKAVLRNVKLGIRRGAYYEITEGIKEGDLAVIMGQQRLFEGASVRIEE